MNIHRITAMVPITDLAQAITFYSQGLGLQVIQRKDEWGHAVLEGEHGCQVRRSSFHTRLSFRYDNAGCHP